MLEPQEKARLKRIAKNIRIEVVKMVSAAGSGHPGGSLSGTDIATTLYFKIMRHDPTNPTWKDRDRFVLSKGHCTPLLYAVLSEAGYFPKSYLSQFRRIDSPLQGHPDRKSLPGIEMSTGALGQGLAIANGMAMGLRLNHSPARVYVLLGDGELQEGMIWESAMSAAHFKIDNMTAIVDLNGIQIDGFTADIMGIEPIADKWRAFGWHVLTIDGHVLEDIDQALLAAAAIKGKPTVIIARTVKGKGVSYMEHNVKFHGSAPNESLTKQALEELENA